MIRVSINPELLQWARVRSGIDRKDLEAKFHKLPEWESGKTRPTLNQIKSFAGAVHVPLGYLFLSSPPEEPVPIPDFRIMGGRKPKRPSPDLQDTIYMCQECQSWYEEFARSENQPPLGFVGSATLRKRPRVAADEIRKTLNLEAVASKVCSTVEEALRILINRAEEAGILVMVSGIVGSNTHRKLDEKEFRGFALADPYAPLVFVNGADSKAGQRFTLAHEIAHIWLGKSALSNLGDVVPEKKYQPEEAWCKAVATELLVPQARLGSLASNSSGTTFRSNLIRRVGSRFARSLIVSTLEGRTLYRDAFRMLGISKNKTFDNLRRELGV